MMVAVAGPGADTLGFFYNYRDSIGRAVLLETLYPVAYAPFMNAPYFPVTGPAVSVVATPDSNVSGITAGTLLPDSIRARVLDAEGRGVAGTTVTWNTRAGSGGITPNTAVTDAGGRAGGLWTLPTLAQVDTGLAFAAGVPAPADFFLTVFSGPAAVVNWQLIQSLTQGVVEPVLQKSATFRSSMRHGALVTNARDAFGNVAQTASGYYFDDIPATGFGVNGLGTVDSTHADTVFFTESTSGPVTYQLHGQYQTFAGLVQDSVVISDSAVGVAARIGTQQQVYPFGSVSADSATINSICPSGQQPNGSCQQTFFGQVIDSAGTPLGYNPGYFITWQIDPPGDTTVALSSTFADTMQVIAQANGTTAVILTINADGPPALVVQQDTLHVLVQQLPGQIAVTPGTLNVGLGDTIVFHGTVTDAGGSPMAVQPAIHWMAPASFGPGEFAGVVKLDSAGDSLIVRLDSGFYSTSNFDWEAVVRAFVELAPGDTISGQGVLFNPIVYDQFSITANGQGHAAVDTGAHRMFVVNGGYLEGLNIDNDAPIGTIGIGSSGSWISVDQDSNRVFVADPVTNSVHIIDGVGFTPLGTANLPGTPNGLAVSPVDHRTYTAMRFCAGGPPFCATSTYIVPIDGSAGVDTALIDDSVRLAIDTLAAPEGLAFNPATGLLYLSTSTGLVYV
jgi:hypothetical protein